jgi:DNA-directed RNA polymerase subunit beta'
MEKIQNRTFQQLEIGLASPKEIRSWAERFLPNGEVVGEVTSWETVNYKTLKPESNGLFCQKIFGPVVDYTCACGKKALKLNIGFCPKCGVERTTSQVRRYRMGYISLKQPVAHTLYASQKPSPLGLCLNWPNKKLQAVLYGTEFCHLPQFFEYFSETKFSQYDWSNFPNRNFINNNSNSLISSKNLFRKKPKLFTINSKFQKKRTWSLFLKLYSKKSLSFNNYLYGISHDMTWRQVEDFQDFLMYSWEQPGSNDAVIPYYSITQLTENYAARTIPIHKQYYPIQTGGFVFQKLFSHYNLVGLQRQLALDLTEVKRTLNFLKNKAENLDLPKQSKGKLQIEISRFKELEKKLLRRLIYFRDFYKANNQPAWMVLSYLPVLPPGLRPITSIRGELVVSDLNSLYRKVLTRNRRLTNSTRFTIFDTSLSGSWASWCYNLRQVQESVDSLLKTGKVESGKTTKSLLDALKGKRGRFRQHLLGKRVDYSGRSVIVVGPQLKIYECGLPKQMAVELFQPFLIQQLRNKGIAFTTTGAKAIISERKPIIWALLREILQSHPVLLNRAPTLHRLGIQAFIPKLVEGKAILLHPLVCPAFNADFDGDQMAVHVPLSPPARAEAFNLLLACNHLLAPASGQPLLLPTQDMILGCYYLTISKEKSEFGLPNFSKEISKIFSTQVGKWYSHFNEVLEDYSNHRVDLHTPIWVQWKGKIQNLISEQNGQERNTAFELRFTNFGQTEFVYFDKYIIHSLIFDRVELTTELVPFRNQSDNNFSQCFLRTTPGKLLLYKLFTLSIN